MAKQETFFIFIFLPDKSQPWFSNYYTIKTLGQKKNLWNFNLMDQVIAKYPIKLRTLGRNEAPVIFD
jgi:hypothetical protein